MLLRVLTACCVGLIGCSGFTEVDSGHPPGDADAASRDTPASNENAPPRQDTFAPGGSGPGPHGALPSGYCCQSDLECRYRSCVDWGGSKMCLDPCQTDDGCKGTVSGLTCNTAAGRCEPDSPTAACVGASSFTYGAGALGSCCVATHDGWAGSECEGNHCDSFAEVTNPYICTQACETPSDCPGAFICMNTGLGYGICAPEAATYSCTK